MARNCIVVNIDRCTGCYACQIACKGKNDVDLGVNWNRVLMQGPFGEYPDMTYYALPAMCQQCENAPCIEVCPTGASYREDGTGIVLIDEDACIGCQTCIPACPYDVRTYNASKNVVEKCTLCNDLVAKGELPACVKSCSAGARFFGDLDDPDSDASKELAKYDDADIHALKDEGNSPTTRYIMTKMSGTWHDVDDLGFHA